MKILNALLLMAATVSISAAAVVIPPALNPGDKIAIYTPSSAIDSTKVDRLDSLIVARGYTPVIAPHAKGRLCGTYPVCEDVRAADLMALFADPEIKAILCARGGHGAIHMVNYLDTALIRRNPKWLIGYSDVTTLHAVMQHAGVASVHGPMSEMIAHPSDPAVEATFAILTGEKPSVEGPACDYNQHGTTTGRLYGGNLITFDDLAETDIDMLDDLAADGDGVILLIEEIDEEMAAVERIMWRLYRSGRLGELRGIIFGQFTDCPGDDSFATVNDMLRYRLQQWGYIEPGGIPIAFDVPVGHDWPNYPLIEGAVVRLTVDPSGTIITYEE